MAGKIFEILPKEYLRFLIDKNPQGGRFRHPPKISKHNPIYVNDRNKQICKERLTGKTINELSNQFALKERTIQRILKENGLEGRIEKKKSRKVQIEELMAYGYTKKGIAEKLGISRQRLYQILKEEGLK